MREEDRLHGKEILIIDDSQISSDSADFIKRAGAAVRMDCSGSISRIKSNLPDLIILNYHLKARNSCELSLLLKKETETRNIPVIFLGSSLDGQQKTEVFRSGADDILLTPLCIEEVLTKLRNLFELHENRRLLREAGQNSLEREKYFKAALQEQESVFEIVFNMVPLQIWYKDIHNRYIRVNKKACTDIGLSYHEIEGHTAGKLFPAFADQYYKDDLEVIQSGKPMFGLSRQINNSSGEIKLLQVDKVPVFGNNQEVIGIVGFLQDITEQISIRNSLEMNEERLLSLFNNSPNSVAVYQVVDDGLDFVFTDFNLTAEKTDQIRREEVIGKRIGQIFPSAQELGLIDAFRRVWKTGKTEYLNSSYYKDNRIEGWRENIIYKLSTGEIVAIYNDTSDKMKSEIALRESEEKFRQLFDNHSAIKLLIDPANQAIVDANEAAAQFYGWTLEELRHMRMQEINMMSPSEIVETIGKAMSRNSAQFEFRHRLKNGKIRDVEVFSSKTVIKGKAYLHAIVHDIHDRRKAEEALLESNHLNDLLLKTIPLGIEIVDESGTILFMSESLEKQIGYKALGLTCWKIFRDRSMQCIECPILNNGIRVGETGIYEIPGMLGDKIFEVSHTGLIYKGKKAVLQIFQDITDRKHNEQELLKAKEKAEESDRLKTAFLHNISHEIRTPMNAIVGFAGLLNDPALAPENRKEFTDVIMQSSQQLLSIITDIINIAAIETDQGKVFNQKFRLNLMMKFLYASFLSRAQKKNLSFRFELDQPDTSDMISCDKSKLESILSNLIGNALKFTRTGRVLFGYTMKSDWIEFYVSDSGIGISANMHQKIFQHFRQVEVTEKRTFGGTGLGLSISKAYVELMGGKIWLTSALGEGSTFYFTIPYRKVSETSVMNEESMRKISSNRPALLIAEDEDSNFMLLEALLAKFSINIVRAFNGKDAVEKYQSNPDVSLILMDIKMPVMDGLEATREIRLLNSRVPIVAQSAYAFPEEKEAALMAGCDAFLSKPFKMDELYKIINETIK